MRQISEGEDDRVLAAECIGLWTEGALGRMNERINLQSEDVNKWRDVT